MPGDWGAHVYSRGAWRAKDRGDEGFPMHARLVAIYPRTEVPYLALRNSEGGIAFIHDDAFGTISEIRHTLEQAKAIATLGLSQIAPLSAEQHGHPRLVSIRAEAGRWLLVDARGEVFAELSHHDMLALCDVRDGCD